MVGTACCKPFPFRPRARADEKQYCQILFLASVLWGFFLLLFDRLGVFFVWLVFFIFGVLLSGVFRTASHCMFFLSVLLGPASLAECPVTDVSVLLM